MKRFSLFAASFVFAAIFAVSAFGQTGTQPAAQPAAGPFKMAVINTAAFDDKTGIGRYTTAMNALETEFKPVQDEIQGMVTRYQALGAEIEKLRSSSTNPAVPVKPETIQAKIDEFQNLETNIKRKQEDAKAKFERREPQVMGPIRQEIGRALQDYAKQKGYALILDAAKLDGAGLILAFDESKVDVTKDFITFFNSRPATTATTATPK
jgi:Skp family chaperone for outer membrane proteins